MPGTGIVALGVFLELVATLCQATSLLQHIEIKKSKDESKGGWFVASLVYGAIGTFLGVLALGMAPLSLLVPVGTFQIVALEIFESSGLVTKWAILKGKSFVCCHNRGITVQVLLRTSSSSSVNDTPPLETTNGGRCAKGGALAMIMAGISVMLVATQFSEIPHPLEKWEDSVNFLLDAPSAVVFSFAGVLAVLASVEFHCCSTNQREGGATNFWKIVRYSTTPALLTAATRILLSTLLDSISTNTAEVLGFAVVAALVVAAAVGQYLTIGSLFAGDNFQAKVPVYYSLQATAVFVFDLVVFQRYVYYSLGAALVTLFGFALIAVGLGLIAKANSK